jgi:phospholipid/cholesterol/gamma-HCH transport system substrate-binding protein
VRSRWNLPIFLVYGVLSLIAFGFIITQLGISAPWSNPYTVTATFRNGSGILNADEVFMNGAKVGRINTVEARDGLAVVTMRLEDQRAYPLYSDSTAQVRIKNLLGETYIELGRGKDSGHPMSTGGSIPVDRTVTPVQIDEVLAVLDPQTRDRLKLLINGAGTALANRGDNLNAQAQSVHGLFTSLNGPANELAARQQQIEAIVLELQRFYDTLARQRDQVRAEFATWNDVTAQLAAQEGAIGGTVQQADLFLQNLDQLVGGEAANIRSTLEQLGPALASTSSFLNQSNTILGALAPYRRSIHDVFPDLGTSFQDINPQTGQHLWSVYSVNCPATPQSSTCTDGNKPASYGAPAGGGMWSQVTGGSG